MKRPMKKLAALAGGALALLLTLCLPFTARAAELNAGVNVINKGAVGETYNIGAGQAVMIANQNSDAADQPIIFKDCVFNLIDKTVAISGSQTDPDGNSVSYKNGETFTKLWVGGNVQFDNCTFETAEGAGKLTSNNGNDAAVYFFSGDIQLNGCELTAEGYNGQFLGLYGDNGAVTFDDCDISTVNNKNGWSYAMYAGSVLKLVNGSTMTATGSTTDSGNINCFYSGDNKTGYDAIFVEDSTIDFSDNKAGGFAINNVNIYVKNSDITVNNNLGNACNSGNWFVENNSSIVMNGNRGGHALSCIGFDMTDSKLEILHNGYAGVYMQSGDSSFTNCTVDIACNGEKLLSYSAGDLWLQGHKLTVTNCTSETQPGSAWLGGVGRKGSVDVASGSIVAYDLNSNAVDNLKSNTEPVLSAEDIALSAEEDKHTLFLNRFMRSDYARGNAESTASNNDADLFKDDRVTDRSDIIGAHAKIGSLTEAQLSHHRYDWANGEITDQATEDTYGVTRYACTLACDDYLGATVEHPNSFDCEGTYVYAPLVGVTFDDNVDDDSVSGMPGDQTEIAYEGTALEPETDPVRTSDDPEHAWIFTGWYTDPDCTELFDFSTELTSNWTVLYAGWLESGIARIEPADITIYMGGDQGYEGVINGENGSYVSENSLPDPGFSFVLPDEVNDALKAAGLATEGNGADLSEYLQIYTKDGSSTWDVTRYGEENSALADGTFLYRIDPAAGYETTHPLRLQFTDAAGNTYLSDDFDPAETDALYEQYQMLIYTGELGRENIILQVEVPETENTEAQIFFCTLDVPEETSGGTLTIRYVTADDPQSVVTDVYEQPEGASAADLESALSQLRADNPSLGFAVLPAGARYYVNESGIDVTDHQNVAPSLLFDEIVSDETGESASTFDSALLDRALGTLDEAGVSLDNVQHEAKFLDLVDANNGNTWLTTDKTVDVYWPYPEGTDADTSFALVHFPGLDREMENDEIGGLIQTNVTEYVSVENTPYGIKFSVTPEMGFSPFVLVWGDRVVIPDTSTSTDAGSDLPATGDVAMIAAASFAALGSAAVVASAITNRRNDNQ